MTNSVLLCEVCGANESNYDRHDTILSCDVNNVELHQIFSSLFIQLPASFA